MYDRGYPLSFPLMDSLNDSVYRSLLKRNFMYSSSLQKLVFTSISEFCEYSRNDYVSFCESIFLLEMLLELRKSGMWLMTGSISSSCPLRSFSSLHHCYRSSLQHLRDLCSRGYLQVPLHRLFHFCAECHSFADLCINFWSSFTL